MSIVVRGGGTNPWSWKSAVSFFASSSDIGGGADWHPNSKQQIVTTLNGNRIQPPAARAQPQKVYSIGSNHSARNERSGDATHPLIMPPVNARTPPAETPLSAHT